MTDDLWHTPVVLTGKVVRLEPFSEAHVHGLAEVGKDKRIWKWMLYGDLVTEEAMHTWVKEILSRQAARADLAFTVFHLASDRIAGATRYMEMRPQHRGLEIGGTWYGMEYQRTAVNTECKYLLLQYAFETLKCVRVQFKADSRNEQSLRAIERLGAKREGVLRNHYILNDGRMRDSVYFSILESEWPGVKEKLEELLKR